MQQGIGKGLDTELHKHYKVQYTVQYLLHLLGEVLYLCEHWPVSSWHRS